MSKKSSPPPTSQAAWRSITKEQINAHHAIILSALKKREKGSAEQLSTMTGLSHAQINRRMSELEKLQIIRRTGETTKTTTGRSASVWAIIEPVFKPLSNPVPSINAKLVPHSSAMNHTQIKLFFYRNT
jgi:hypothetical protein